MESSMLTADDVSRLDRKALKPLCKQYGVKMLGTNADLRTKVIAAMRADSAASLAAEDKENDGVGSSPLGGNSRFAGNNRSTGDRLSLSGKLKQSAARLFGGSTAAKQRDDSVACEELSSIHGNAHAQEFAQTQQPAATASSTTTATLFAETFTQPSASLTPLKDPYWERKMRALVGEPSAANKRGVDNVDGLSSRFKAVSIARTVPDVVEKQPSNTPTEPVQQEQPSESDVVCDASSQRSESPIEQMRRALQNMNDVAYEDTETPKTAVTTAATLTLSPTNLDTLASDLDVITCSLEQIPSPPARPYTPSVADDDIEMNARMTAAIDASNGMDFEESAVEDMDYESALAEALAMDEQLAASQNVPSKQVISSNAGNDTPFTVRMQCVLDGAHHDLPPTSWYKLALHRGRVWVIEGTRWTRLLLNEREMRISMESGKDDTYMDSQLEICGIDDETRDQWMAAVKDNFICRGCRTENARRVGARMNSGGSEAAASARMRQTSELRGRSPYPVSAGRMRDGSEVRGRSLSVASWKSGGGVRHTASAVSASPARSLSTHRRVAGASPAPLQRRAVHASQAPVSSASRVGRGPTACRPLASSQSTGNVIPRRPAAKPSVNSAKPQSVNSAKPQTVAKTISTTATATSTASLSSVSKPTKTIKRSSIPRPSVGMTTSKPAPYIASPARAVSPYPTLTEDVGSDAQAVFTSRKALARTPPRV